MPFCLLILSNIFLQLVDILREKVTTGSFFALRHGFRAFDPQGNGTVTKEALYRILFNFLGYLSHQKFVVLLQRYVRVDDDYNPMDLCRWDIYYV